MTNFHPVTYFFGYNYLILSTSNTPSVSIEGKQWIVMFRTFLFKIYIIVFLWVLTTTLRQCQFHCPSSWLSQSKYRQLNVWTFILVSTYFVLVNEIPLWRFKVSETPCKICFPILSKGNTDQYWWRIIKQIVLAELVVKSNLPLATVFQQKTKWSK